MADGYPNEIPLISPDFKAVSMQHALTTGFAGIYSREPEKGVIIDLATDNAGKRAIDRMTAEAIRMIQESPAATQLLAEPTWTKSQRERWERSIANIARDLIYDEPLFGVYRLDRTKPMTPISITEISKDTNFHCEPMAALNGIMLQKLENHFLQPSADRSQLKRRTDYYLTGGQLYESAFQTGKRPADVRQGAQNGEILHGYILSPVTANYIEGTRTRSAGWMNLADSAYNINDLPTYTFDDYLAGFPMLSGGAGFSVGYDGSIATQQLATQRRQAIARNDFASLDTLRVTEGTQTIDWRNFADERNLLQAMGVCKIDQDAPTTVVDAFASVNQRVMDVPNTEGRNFKQLACDAATIDFAVTPAELSRASAGSRLGLVARNRNFVQRIANQGIENVSGKAQWTEAELVTYLHEKGVNDVWVQRSISSSAPASGNNFEAVVKQYYDALPAKMLTIKTNGVEEKIPFHAYLTLCQNAYLERGGNAQSINAPGTVVPVIHSPARAYDVLKQLNGRSNAQYELDEIPAEVSVAATVVNHRGTSDAITIKMVGIINGHSATDARTLTVAIPESIGELAAPVTPHRQRAQPAARRAAQ